MDILQLLCKSKSMLKFKKIYYKKKIELSSKTISCETSLCKIKIPWLKLCKDMGNGRTGDVIRTHDENYLKTTYVDLFNSQVRIFYR